MVTMCVGYLGARGDTGARGRGVTLYSGIAGRTRRHTLGARRRRTIGSVLCDISSNQPAWWNKHPNALSVYTPYPCQT